VLSFPIYLDNHATTPVDRRVLEAMLPYFSERFGNAASRNHVFGWQADEAVERARKQLADLIGASAREIVFTSGATESNNLAIKGAAAAYRDKGDHIVTALTEHKAVIDTCKHLSHEGCRVTVLPVQRDGRIDLDELRDAMTDRTVLISIMAANNETGVLQPLEEIGAIARERGVLLHTDAVQAAGKVPFDVNRMHVDLASLTAHKMYGPKGVGALFVRRKNPHVELMPLIDGGGQERGVRPGTLNVPGIAGFGAAADVCRREMAEESARTGHLRDRLLHGLRDRLDGVEVNGSIEHRLPQNLNVSFADVQGESLLMAISDIALSSGAACTTDKIEPSYVIKALGVSDDRAKASLRFGLGRYTTEEEIDYVIEKIASVVTGLRRTAGALRSA
jgi:cysteine desulfurase